MGRKAKAGLSLRVECADIPGFLSYLTEIGVTICDTELIDALVIRMTVHSGDYGQVKRAAEKFGGEVHITGNYGVLSYLKAVWRRRVFLGGVIVMLLLTVLLQGRILFVIVDGNESVPDRRILECAERYGVGFLSSRSAVRSEAVKNALLAQINGLQWVGVNTKGCVATISVRERGADEQQTLVHAVTSIVAERDGVIDSAVATSGSLLCKPGQAVRKGDVLISGFTDCGNLIQATRASGEVFALTKRQITVRIPAEQVRIRNGAVCGISYGVILGKKRFIIYNNSGISETGCGKMYEVLPLLLPGGFRLPVALVKETWYNQRVTAFDVAEDDARVWLSCFADNYVRGLMLGGEILSRADVLYKEAGQIVYECSYMCREMIGREYNEEIVQ